jgi:DTW domain-containing protein YfiP
MRGVAFRMDKHFRARGMKILKCPYCGREFETVGCDVKVQLRGFKRGTAVDSHQTIACRICKNPVGIVYLA